MINKNVSGIKTIESTNLDAITGGFRHHGHRRSSTTIINNYGAAPAAPVQPFAASMNVSVGW